jgi:hypothetical protein
MKDANGKPVNIKEVLDTFSRAMLGDIRLCISIHKDMMIGFEVLSELIKDPEFETVLTENEQVVALRRIAEFGEITKQIGELAEKIAANVDILTEGMIKEETAKKPVKKSDPNTSLN